MSNDNLHVNSRGSLEILAPAGDWNALRAAVTAGADAVYFGLQSLNARRRARNFTLEEARHAVDLLHAHGRRAYLTLNTDISYRELGLAIAVLRQAAEIGVDAILIRDPALLAFRKCFPQLEFHFSTQTCMANSADVAAAAELGADRVVLARELSLEEIRRIAQQSPIDLEVFVQGALCFSVSGRCLMSSWVGGRSGNRGLCASPCRVPWAVEGQQAGHPLSMHDLCALEHIFQLHEAGVRAVKIEGRLKTADWVARAVAIYRRALAGDNIDELKSEARSLTSYTGRELTNGYLIGEKTNLTGSNRGRVGRDEISADAGDGIGGNAREVFMEGEETPAFSFDKKGFEFTLSTANKRIECQLRWYGNDVTWEYPKTVVRRAHKAVTAAELCEMVQGRYFQGCAADHVETDDPEFLLVPRTVNAILDRISAEIGRIRRAENKPIVIDFPEGGSFTASDLAPATNNVRALGDMPNRVRIGIGQLTDFVSRVQPVHLIVDGAGPEDVPTIAQVCRKHVPIVALPPVCFEDELSRMEELVERCRKARLGVEVNSWGGWWLARRAGIGFEAGPGLGVLNPLAAAFLRKLGARSVTISVEADRRQIEDICAYAPVALSLYVMGRPPLAISRAELPEEFLGRVFADRRDLRMRPAREWGLWVFRPLIPFDWRRLRNDRIRVKHLVVDLVGSPDPVGEWLGLTSRSRPFTFNYHRTLQ
ncbi:U32 family peptidase [Thermogutta sp.]|uniref:peptidase U32 family protein n=1 Tax=Thermogutta sp. TaxID=1962930 RepID=UPI003C7B7901